MTVIAYDENIVAADRMATFDGTKIESTKIEIFNNEIIAVCGAAPISELMKNWYKDGAIVENYPKLDKDCPDASVIVFKQSGVFMYNDGYPEPMKIENEKYAFGCGSHYAISALHFGATAEDAVKTTIKLDYRCGFGVDVLKMPWI